MNMSSICSQGYEARKPLLSVINKNIDWNKTRVRANPEISYVFKSSFLKAKDVRQIVRPSSQNIFRAFSPWIVTSMIERICTVYQNNSFWSTLSFSYCFNFYCKKIKEIWIWHLGYFANWIFIRIISLSFIRHSFVVALSTITFHLKREHKFLMDFCVLFF